MMIFILFLMGLPARAEYPPPLGNRQFESRGEADSAKPFPQSDSAGKIPLADSFFLTGRCILDSSTETIQLSCPQLSVALLDSTAKKIETTMVVDGKFKFNVKPGHDYYVALESKDYSLDKPKLGPVRRGDEVLLKVKKKGK